MSRKNPLIFISLSIVAALVFASVHVNPVKAQDDAFPVTVELTGVIQSMTSTQLVLADNTPIKIVPATDLASGLSAGAKVVVVAEFDDEQYVAQSVQIAVGSSSTSTLPSDDDKGNNGKGKGKNGKSNGNSDDEQDGKGKNSKGNAKGNNGKGNSDDQGSKGNNGKGNDKDKDKADKNKAACLARTDHPVATRLADTFEVSYTEIMKWHCDGIGFGEIARAYLIARHSKLTVDQIFTLRKKHMGWGQIIKASGLKAKDIAGLGKLMGKKANKTDD
jgi:hypothetical protein